MPASFRNTGKAPFPCTECLWKPSQGRETVPGSSQSSDPKYQAISLLTPICTIRCSKTSHFPNNRFLKTMFHNIATFVDSGIILLAGCYAFFARKNLSCKITDPRKRSRTEKSLRFGGIALIICSLLLAVASFFAEKERLQEAADAIKEPLQNPFRFPHHQEL